MTHCRSTLLSLLFSALSGAPAPAQCTTALASAGPVHSVSGDVRAMTSWDPDGSGPAAPVLVVVGQNLTAGDHHARHVLIHDGAQWTDPGFPSGAMGPLPLMAVIVRNGEVVVGGDFDLPVPGGVAMRGVARWDGATWRAAGTGIVGFVRALTVHNGELFAGGNITQAGGSPVSNIARWNGTTWSPVGAGVSGIVHVLTSFAGLLWVGGALTSAGGATVTHLARWNGTTWSAAGNPNAPVRSFAVRTGTIGGSILFAGGSFSSIGGTSAQRVASVDSVAAVGPAPAWAALGSGLSGTVMCLLVRNNGPFFEVIAGVEDPATPRVWRWNGTSWTGLANPVDPTFLGIPMSLVVHGGRYVVGLLFTQRAVQSFDSVASAWTPVSGSGISDTVHAVLQDGDDLIVGGSFRSIDGIVVNGVARRSGATWSPLGTGVQGLGATVHALARLPNGDLVAGGTFSSAGGILAANVARWNGTSWSAMNNVSGTVFALKTLANGQLVAGGAFDVASSAFVDHVARWNGSAWQPMGTGTGGPVLCLAETPTGDVIAGGGFFLAGGMHGTARWNGTTWTPLGTGMDDTVLAVAALPNGDVVAGGRFLTASGQPIARIAHFDGVNWLPFGPGANDRVLAIAVLPDGDVLIGGEFTTTNGPTPRIARWDGTSWSGFAGGIGGTAVHALAVAGSEVVIAGDFFAAGGAAAGNLARLASSCPALAVRYGVACASPAGTLTSAATWQPWLGNTFVARTHGFTSSFGIPLVMFGFQLAAVPIAPLLPGYPGCIAHTTPDVLAVQPLTPLGVTSTLVVPLSTPLIGAQVFHQVVFLDLDTAGTLLGIASSNGLHLTIGTL